VDRSVLCLCFLRCARGFGAGSGVGAACPRSLTHGWARTQGLLLANPIGLQGRVLANAAPPAELTQKASEPPKQRKGGGGGGRACPRWRERRETINIIAGCRTPTGAKAVIGRPSCTATIDGFHRCPAVLAVGAEAGVEVGDSFSASWPPGWQAGTDPTQTASRSPDVAENRSA
jgi:hypothetical protein